MKVWKNLDIFTIFLFVRLSSVFLVQTFFVPDEYWQSLEVAHRTAFNFGYLTWEWRVGIRSYLYPSIFTVLYKILEVLNLDSPDILIFSPRILQAVLSAYSDLCFYEWSGSKKWAIFCVSSSWFWFYTGSRTLINSFETAITTIALSLFPWPDKDESFTFLWLVAVLCVVRPTAAIVWFPLCLYHFHVTSQRIGTLLFKRYFPIGLTVLTICTILDSIAYGRFVITGYEFIRLNVFENVATNYGTHPWFWYLSNGLPAVLGIQFVPFVIAAFAIIRSSFNYPNELFLLGTIAFTIAMYSCLPHKEFRFILPVLPMALYISSRFLSAWSHKANKQTLWLIASAILIGNLIPSFYLGFIHQRGTLEVMKPLREIAWKSPQNTSFLFLMPCHSTPYYSHLHINVWSRFITCEPNLNQSANYIDEVDEFYAKPMAWIRMHYPPHGALPSHIICFDSLVPAISPFLSRYKIIHQIFHTSFPSSRIGSYVLINQLIN